MRTDDRSLVEAFFDAVCNRDEETFLFLLDNLLDSGFDIDMRDSDGDTALHAALYCNYTHLAIYLLSAGADPNIVASDGLTPMQIAIDPNDYSTVRKLATCGADLTYRSADGKSYLDQACDGRNFGAATALLDSGMRFKDLMETSRTEEARVWLYRTAAAICASVEGGIDRMRPALESGLDPNTEGYMPLIVAAARRGDTRMVRLLLDYGANPNEVGTWGGTALHMAALWGHRATVRELLAAGADKDKATRWRETPLQAARRGGHPRIVQDLLDAGAKENG